MTAREITWGIALGTATALGIALATGLLALLGYAIAMMEATQ